MKLPIWFKDKHGKWHLFPQQFAQHLETFADGKRGVTHNNVRNTLWEIDNGVILNFWDIFEYNSKLDLYILKDQS